MSDYFESRFGLIYQDRWRPRIVGRLRDALYDAGAALFGANRRSAAIAAATPRRSILVVGVAHPDRPGQLEAVAERFRESRRHQVSTSLVRMQPGVGKFQNIAQALAQADRPLSEFDWVVITDDDIALPRGFLDRFIGLAEFAGLKLAQPAHRFFSYTTFAITQRRWGSLARATRWVEIGPVTALHRDTLRDLLPFPEARWDWGLDVYWAQLAERNGWRLGVVDGVPMEHRRPVAGTYDSQAAITEGAELLSRYGVTLTRTYCLSADQVVVHWRPERTPKAQSAACLPLAPGPTSRAPN